MSIGLQAYLRGYMHEKTASESEEKNEKEHEKEKWERINAERADRFHRGQGKPGAQSFQEYIEQAGTHPWRQEFEEGKKKREDALQHGIFT